MYIFRWMHGNTIRNKIRNEDILVKLGIVPIEDARKPPMMI